MQLQCNKQMGCKCRMLKLPFGQLVGRAAT
jgi:hypothetical protein